MGCEQTKTATLGAGTMFKVSYDCGQTFTLIPGMTAIGATGNMGEATETTSIDEKARTYIGSLETPPNKTFTGNYRPENAAQKRFYEAARKKEVIHLRIEFPTNPISVCEQHVALLGFQVNEPQAEQAITFSVGGQASGQARWFEIPVVGVTAISVPTQSLTGAVGETDSVVVTYTPANATNQTSSFLSANPEIASVDSETGDVKFNKVGETDIYVVSNDGSYEATQHVIVTAAN